MKFVGGKSPNEKESQDAAHHIDAWFAVQFKEVRGAAKTTHSDPEGGHRMRIGRIVDDM